MDNLTIEQLSDIAALPRDSGYERQGSFKNTAIDLARQLLDVMRENERLREAISAHNMAMITAPLGQPAVFGAIKVDTPYKQSDHIEDMRDMVSTRQQ